MPSPGDRRRQREQSSSGLSRLRSATTANSGGVTLNTTYVPGNSTLTPGNPVGGGPSVGSSARNSTVFLVPGLDVKASQISIIDFFGELVDDLAFSKHLV
jgi:hypothetical protein